MVILLKSGISINGKVISDLITTRKGVLFMDAVNKLCGMVTNECDKAGTYE